MSEDQAVAAAAAKIVRWGIEEARERDAMWEEATTIALDRGLSDEDDSAIVALAARIEDSIKALVPGIDWEPAR